MFKPFLFVCGIFLIAAQLFSCKDQETIAGSDYLLEKTQINTSTHSFTVDAFTVKEDSLRTDGSAGNSVYLLGHIDDDSIFGRSFASIYTQLLLSHNSPVLGSDLTLDSVVLTLAFIDSIIPTHRKYYGSIGIPQTYIVYQLLDDMDPDEKYYSNQTFNHSSIELGRKENAVPNVSKYNIFTENDSATGIRIRLQDSFGELLLANSNTTHFSNNSAFTKFFKGIYITSDTNQTSKSIMYIDMNSSLSNLTLYYKNSTGNDTFHFEMTKSAAKSNLFQHNISNTKVKQAVSNQSDPNLYIQSMAGVKAKIEIPFDSIRALGKIGITKAEITFSSVFRNGPDTIFAPPYQMYCLRVDENGNNDFIKDMFEGNDYYGGIISSGTNSQGQSIYEYSFNLARHFQSIINNEFEDYGLFLITFPSSQIADRIIIGGGNHSSSKIKLNLTYTKFD